MRVVVTGVPGTGKTSISRKLSARLGCRLVEVNKVLEKKRLWRGKDASGAKIALMGPLGKALGEEMLRHESVIVEGHLACEFPLPADRVVVLRTDPAVLGARLGRRKYPPAKTRENVFAELLDYCTIRSEQNYGKRKVAEMDTTKSSPESAAREIVAILKGKRKPKEVSWAKKLEELV
ncbi:MAG: adenylate kinase family protein [Candidatus ainarchaeum sp.]|nr:adenylate kinase family protein [Candidatus ainarchaeum sp.]